MKTIERSQFQRNRCARALPMCQEEPVTHVSERTNLHQTRVVPCLYREPENFFTAPGSTRRKRQESTFSSQTLHFTISRLKSPQESFQKDFTLSSFLPKFSVLSVRPLCVLCVPLLIQRFTVLRGLTHRENAGPRGGYADICDAPTHIFPARCRASVHRARWECSS